MPNLLQHISVSNATGVLTTACALVALLHQEAKFSLCGLVCVAHLVQKLTHALALQQIGCVH